MELDGGCDCCDEGCEFCSGASGDEVQFEQSGGSPAAFDDANEVAITNNCGKAITLTRVAPGYGPDDNASFPTPNDPDLFSDQGITEFNCVIAYAGNISFDEDYTYTYYFDGDEIFDDGNMGTTVGAYYFVDQTGNAWLYVIANTTFTGFGLELTEEGLLDLGPATIDCCATRNVPLTSRYLYNELGIIDPDPEDFAAGCNWNGLGTFIITPICA